MEVREMLQDLFPKNDAQPLTERADAKMRGIHRKPSAFGEKLGLDLIAREVEVYVFLVTPVTQNVPAELQNHVLVAGQANVVPFGLGPLVKLVGFGDEAERTGPGRVELARQLRYLLVVKFVACGYNGQNDAPGPRHRLPHHSVHRFHVFNRLLGTAGPENAWQVNHGYMRLIRTANFDTQHIITEAFGIRKPHGGFGGFDDDVKRLARIDGVGEPA